MSNEKIKTASIKVLSPIITTLLEDNSSVKLKITGNSMYPLFRSGADTIILTNKPVVSKYDIILYRRTSGEYIIHRVVKIKNDVLYLAGDNEIEIEYPIYENQVIATVESFFRNGKHIFCTGFYYKLYSRIWVLILPFRHKVLSVYKRLRCAIRWKRL